MKGELNILLWIGGMLFGLAAFAVKVGLGLAFGRYNGKETAFTVAGYVLLFVTIALLSGPIMNFLGPILRKGPYLHSAIAAGMILWGFVTLKGIGRNENDGAQANGGASPPHRRPLAGSLLLLLPCPVCLTAMAFSTWSVLSVIGAPAAVIGLGLGLSFGIMTLLVMVSGKRGRTEHPETTLGLTLITLGLYFVAALFLPAKIEEAKTMYAARASEVSPALSHDVFAVMAILAFLALIGFTMSPRKGVFR